MKDGVEMKCRLKPTFYFFFAVLSCCTTIYVGDVDASSVDQTVTLNLTCNDEANSGQCEGICKTTSVLSSDDTQVFMYNCGNSGGSNSKKFSDEHQYQLIVTRPTVFNYATTNAVADSSCSPILNLWTGAGGSQWVQKNSTKNLTIPFNMTVTLTSESGTVGPTLLFSFSNCSYGSLSIGPYQGVF